MRKAITDKENKEMNNMDRISGFEALEHCYYFFRGNTKSN